MEIKNIENLILFVNNLPEVSSVKVPVEPTSFCSTEMLILSTDKNWKDEIIKQCVLVCSKNAITRIVFNGYYGDYLVEGNSYYIQLYTDDGLTQSSVIQNGKLD